MADYYLNKTAARIDYLLDKVEGIEAGAEVNQNALSSVVVNGTTVSASAKTDSIELVAGTNVTVTADASNKTVTVSAVDTTYSDATTSTSGLMSSSDKTKLDGIATGAEVNVQSNWNQTDTSADDYILNKPTIPDAQVNSDWNANSGVAQILNKPVIDSAPTLNSANLVESGGVYTALGTKQDALTVGTNLDSAPTENSNNPVTSDGVYTGLSGKVNVSDIPTEAQIDAMFA